MLRRRLWLSWLKVAQGKMHSDEALKKEDVSRNINTYTADGDRQNKMKGRKVVA